MTIYNLGSINIDHFYRVPHLVQPGETLTAKTYSMGLGGKGANQSVAAARAGAVVRHIGGAGPEGWAVARLEALGVDCRFVEQVSAPTGHAIISVDDAGENTIILYAGANREFALSGVTLALAGAGAGDTLLIQNETAHQVAAARMARERGMKVIYSAAPFDVVAVQDVLPYASLLALNAVEAEQLSAALGTVLANLPVPEVLVTRGAQGAEWCDLRSGRSVVHPAFPVEVIDTTGAGDTVAGYFAAALDEGLTVQAALRLATAAAALKVTRAGTADAIPTRAEVEAFLKGMG
ncbi:PfkB family carbohydrate kinase [Phaeovulum sp.]|uniref:PfkB family carbohydrate kinase n=1 Tax=Phaeovulum sp. TaxID=2934796 RepID=UPI0039E5356A